MNLQMALTQVTHNLHAQGIPYPAREAIHLIAHVTGKGHLEQILHPEQVLSAAEVATLQELAARRAKREPLAYVLGYADFWGHRFQVVPDVLCPRPDSETLIATLVTLIPPQAATTVVDVGVGSGVLICSLLHAFSNLTGIGVDISPTALALTLANAQALGVQDRLELRQSDVLAQVPEQVNIIIANPPYIASDVLAELEPEVRDYEPKLALDGGPDGLAAYRQLIPQAAQRLVAGGLLALEIGATQRENVLAFCNEQDWQTTQCIQDIQGLDRVILAVKR